MMPCFKNSIASGDDLSTHILRIESIYNAIKSGQGYPTYIYQDMIEGYGYAMGLFYPDVFLLPAVAFRALGASPELAMKIYFFLLLMCTCGTSYVAGRYIGNSKFIGAITMVLYTMGHYHIQDMYRRAAVSELVAMVFIPFFFLCLCDFTERGYHLKGLFCLTFSCLMLSHTISFVLCVMGAVLWCFIRIKKILDRKHICGLLLEALGCALLTCYYWIPVLEQFASGSFYVSNEPEFFTQEDTMSFLGILTGRYSVAFIEIGILLLLIFVGIDRKKRDRKATYMLVAAVAILLMETKLFPWKLIDKTPLVSIQFPWRLNMFVEFILALGISCQTWRFCEKKVAAIKAEEKMKNSECGMSALKPSGKKETAEKVCVRWSICIPIILSVAVGIFNVLIVWNKEILYFTKYDTARVCETDFSDNIGFWEWLPAEADLADTVYSDNPYEIFGESYSGYGVYESDGSFTFDGSVIDETVTIPKYYYKGYVASLKMEDGSDIELDIEKNPDNGLIMIDASDVNGEINVYYKGTTLQRASRLVSAVAFVVAVIMCIYLRLKRKQK
jgi:hypothetical protein